MPTQPLDAALLARTKTVTAGLNAEGLRVVAVAVKDAAAGTERPIRWPTKPG